MSVLKLQKREGTGKYVAFGLRRQGMIPGVVYGRDRENQNVALSLREFRQILHTGARLVDLELDGQTQQAIIKDVQHGTFDQDILHADFRAVSSEDIVHMDVEVVLVGEAPGCKAGGVLDHSLYKVAIECKAKDLPDRIMLDLGNLELKQARYVSDLPVLPGVKYVTHANVPVVSCHMPRGQEDAAAAPAEGAATEPEVIGAKKDKEEGAEEKK